MFILVLSIQADNSLFDSGNKFYQEKEYSKAIDSYTQLIDDDIESAPLYFNLGNAYFKNGDLGHAVLFYMKAKRLAPTDEDIIHNLEFAQRFSSIQMEGVELNPIRSFMASIVDSYTLNFLSWTASLMFVLLLVFLILRFGLGQKTPIVKVGIIVFSLSVLGTSGLTTFKYRYEYLTKRAVIIAENPIIYTGASEQSDIELEAAPGLIVEVLSESEEFYNVLFENKRRGWIKKELIAGF